MMAAMVWKGGTAGTIYDGSLMCAECVGWRCLHVEPSLRGAQASAPAPFPCITYVSGAVKRESVWYIGGGEHWGVCDGGDGNRAINGAQRVMWALARGWLAWVVVVKLKLMAGFDRRLVAWVCEQC
jgi:hypothetical protein